MVEREPRWFAVPAGCRSGWTELLLDAGASFYQLPYWNEPYRRTGTTPHYLSYGPPERARAAVCVLVLGPPGFRIGLIHRGPVRLAPGGPPPARLAADLRTWARQRGIAFLRFTHEDAELLDALAASGPCERVDAFPFHRADPTWDLVLHLPKDPALLVPSFRRDARREIRRDGERGYEIRVERSPLALARVWPMFEAHARRRGFRHTRPLGWWQDVMREATPHATARLYVAALRGTPVAADLYVYDRTRVRSITAWDADALAGERSPSTQLLHRAMGDFIQAGLREFTFGPAWGSLVEYKNRFRPTRITAAPPLTLIVSPVRYAVWRSMLLRVGPRWRKLRHRLGRIREGRPAPEAG